MSDIDSQAQYQQVGEDPVPDALAPPDTQARPSLSQGSVWEMESKGQIEAKPFSDDTPDDVIDNDVDDELYTGFFQVGRDFEASNQTHKFTAKEKQRMQQFETLNYRPPASLTRKTHLEKQPQSTYAQKWLMFCMIGAATGLTAFLLKQTIERIVYTRTSEVDRLLEDGDKAGAYFFSIVHSLAFTLASTCLVVFLAPLAAGSGVPEVMGYLNGVHLPKLFNVKTNAIRFLSAICAVGSGLPVGPEGPMISLGSAIGAGLPQGRSKTLGFSTEFFQQFRNSQDKRDFITGGAAAGVSAAFGAPVGGLLFAMEEVASFWGTRLTWMIFFGCMVSTFTVNLFASAFDKWEWMGDFGYFDDNSTILFHVNKVIRFNILAVPAVVVIGGLGGLLGTIFTFINLKVTRMRNRSVKPYAWRRIIEPCIVMIIFGTIMFLLPAGFSCREKVDGGENELEVVRYDCEEGFFNPMATLSMQSGDDAIKHLLSRGSIDRFGYGHVLSFFIFYFLFACYIAGSSISSGLVVPMLLIGACVGRFVGLVMVDMFGDSHAWIDPGVFALIGAAGFFGGVSRLTISLTIIMVEISNDIHLLLAIMVSVMISKWVADFVTHSLYHALLEIKCVPFLDDQPVVPKLDCFNAADIMSDAVQVIDEKIQVRTLVEVLERTKHNGFPLVAHTVRLKKKDQENQPETSQTSQTVSANQEQSEILQKPAGWHELSLSIARHAHADQRFIFKGLVVREQLLMILRHPEHFVSNRSDPMRPIDYPAQERYESMSKMQKLRTSSIRNELDDADLDKWVDLAPYSDTSAVTVNAAFSVQMTYMLFRSLGLRHLVVVDDFNEPVGMITRKDLLGQTIEERIGTKQKARQSDFLM